MAKHGVYVQENATSVSTPDVAESGIPFFLGTAPVQSAESPAKPNIPVLCTSWAEAVEKLGYSEDWEKYTLCEAMYSHFKLYACQPAIFCSISDVAKVVDVAAEDINIVDHKITLPMEAVNDSKLVVKAAGGEGDALVMDTDYSTYYTEENLVVELISGTACYSAAALSVAYTKCNTTVDLATVANGLEAIELCMSTAGVVPDLICVPGFSSEPTIAAAMAAKAPVINGLFKAKALVDMDTKTVKTYEEAIAKKTGEFSDSAQIPCWPMLGLGGRKFHMSTQLAGLIAQIDIGNEGKPYESPDNKPLMCDSMILHDGTEVFVSLAQANTLNAAGILTTLNFLGSWVAWGNYTGCYPKNKDVKDCFIPVSRMFGWVGNTVIKTFWQRLGKPMNRLLIDSIIDTCNIWLSGLCGSGYLLGARVEFNDDENPLTALMSGIIKFHIYITPPSPAQEFDFVLEYDASYVTEALQG